MKIPKQEYYINFAGEKLLLSAKGAIFWQAESILIISDLHFEKGSFLAKEGSMIPAIDTFDTLKIIANLIAKYNPNEVICLGDSFHDLDAHIRIADRDLESLQNMILKANKWVWILGNHDPEIPSYINGERYFKYEKNNITFLHEPEKDIKHQIIGHFHPKFKKRLNGVTLKGKCFVNNDELLIMPSLGSYTGGLEVTSKPLKSLFKNDANYHLIYNDKIWKI